MRKPDDLAGTPDHSPAVSERPQMQDLTVNNTFGCNFGRKKQLFLWHEKKFKARKKKLKLPWCYKLVPPPYVFYLALESVLFVLTSTLQLSTQQPDIKWQISKNVSSNTGLPSRKVNQCQCL